MFLDSRKLVAISVRFVMLDAFSIAWSTSRMLALTIRLSGMMEERLKSCVTRPERGLVAGEDEFVEFTTVGSDCDPDGYLVMMISHPESNTADRKVSITFQSENNMEDSLRSKIRTKKMERGLMSKVTTSPTLGRVRMERRAAAETEISLGPGMRYGQKRPRPWLCEKRETKKKDDVSDSFPS
jgi:hypothetical protein